MRIRWETSIDAEEERRARSSGKYSVSVITTDAPPTQQRSVDLHKRCFVRRSSSSFQRGHQDRKIYFHARRNTCVRTVPGWLVRPPVSGKFRQTHPGSHKYGDPERDVCGTQYAVILSRQSGKVHNPLPYSSLANFVRAIQLPFACGYRHGSSVHGLAPHASHSSCSKSKNNIIIMTATWPPALALCYKWTSNDTRNN